MVEPHGGVGEAHVDEGVRLMGIYEGCGHDCALVHDHDYDQVGVELLT